MSTFAIFDSQAIPDHRRDNLTDVTARRRHLSDVLTFVTTCLVVVTFRLPPIRPLLLYLALYNLLQLVKVVHVSTSLISCFVYPVYNESFFLIIYDEVLIDIFQTHNLTSNITRSYLKPSTPTLPTSFSFTPRTIHQLQSKILHKSIYYFFCFLFLRHCCKPLLVS